MLTKILSSGLSLQETARWMDDMQLYTLLNSVSVRMVGGRYWKAVCNRILQQVSIHWLLEQQASALPTELPG